MNQASIQNSIGIGAGLGAGKKPPLAGNSFTQWLLRKPISGGNIVLDNKNKGTARPILQGVAPDFNGTSGYVEIPHSPLLTFGDGAGNDSLFSMFFRINMDDATNFRLANKDSVGGPQFDFTLSVSGTDKLACALTTGGSTSNRIGRICNTTALTSYQGQDLFIIWTYSGSKTSAGIKMYVYDSAGNLITSDDTDDNVGTYTGMDAGTGVFGIGVRQDSSLFANGRIWDVRILDHVATQAEIDTYVKRNNKHNPEDELTGTIEHWKLDENGGKTAYGCVNKLNGEYFNITWVNQNNISFQNEQGYSVGASYEQSATAGTYWTDGLNWVREINYQFDFSIELDFISPTVLPTSGTEETLFRCNTTGGGGNRVGLSWKNQRLMFVVYNDVTLPVIRYEVLNASLTPSTFYTFKVTFNATTNDVTELTLNGQSIFTTSTQIASNIGGNRFCLGIAEDLIGNPLISKGATILRLKTITPTYGTNEYTAANQWQDVAPVGTDNSTVEYPRLPALSGSTITGFAGNSLDYKGSAPKNGLAINNHCGDFNGTADRIDIPHSSLLTFGNGTTDSPFSIMCKVNMDDASNARFFSKSNGTNVEYVMYCNATDNFSFRLYDNVGAHRIDAVAGATLTAYQGQIIYLIGTYNGSGLNTGVEIYAYTADGVSIPLSVSKGSAGTYVAMEGNSLAQSIGHAAIDNTFNNGKIFDVRVLDRVATADDISKFLSGERIVDAVLDMPIAEGEGNTTFDKSGNNLHGTITATSLTTFWASTQDNYAHNLKHGFNEYDVQGMGTGNYLELDSLYTPSDITNYFEEYEVTLLENADLMCGGNTGDGRTHINPIGIKGRWNTAWPSTGYIEFDTPLNLGQKYKIKVHRVGSLFSVYVDDVLQVDNLTQGAITRNVQYIGAYSSTPPVSIPPTLGIIHSVNLNDDHRYTNGIWQDEIGTNDLTAKVAGVATPMPRPKIPLAFTPTAYSNPAGAWYNGAESNIQLNPYLDPRLYRSGITDTVNYSLDVENPINPTFINDSDAIKQKDMLTYCNDLTVAQIEAIEAYLKLTNNILIRQGALADWDFGDATKVFKYDALDTTVASFVSKINGAVVGVQWASDFSAGTDSMTVDDVTIDGNIDGIFGEDDCLRVTCNGVNSVHYTSRSSAFVTGRMYDITAKVYIPSSNNAVNQVQLKNGSSVPLTTITTLDTWVTVSFKAPAPLNGQLRFYLLDDGVEAHTGGNGDVVYLKDIVTTEIATKNLSQATGAQTPAHIDTNSDAVLDALEFDGIDENLTSVESIADILALTQGEIFLVFNTGSAGVGQFISIGDKDTDLDFLAFGRSQTNLYRMSVTKAGALNGIDFGAVQANTWVVLSFRSDGTSYKCYVNGVESTLSAGTDNGDWMGDVSNLDQIAIGKLARSTATYYDMDVRGLVIFPTVQDAERANIVKYLKARHLVP